MRLAIALIITTLISFNTHTVFGDTTDIVDTAIANGNFQKLVFALNATDLVSTLKSTGPFTVFAPDDTAFGKLPNGVLDQLLDNDNKNTLSRILQYHVANGNITAEDIQTMTLPTNLTMIAGGYTTISKRGADLYINNANVTTPNVFATNGIIHVIDNVILPPLDIVEQALVNGNFKTLLTALKAADLVSTLKGTGPFTVFAPTDAAFQKLPAGTVDDLLKPENKDKLANILKYHVVSGSVKAADILAMSLPAQVNTVASIRLIVDRDGASVKINDATVTTPDVQNTNGIIHIVDTVILPPTDIPTTAIANDNFKTLVQALTAADLVNALKGDGPFTVFAPNDAAFSKLPNGVVAALVLPENKPTLTRVLQYHVTASLISSKALGRMTLPANVNMLAGGSARVTNTGGKFQIQGAEIIAVDVFNTNGLIHVIDNVILPPLDIVERALVTGNFKTLLAALKAADLVSALKGTGPFTVFAPNDAAFSKLSNETLNDLLKPENKEKLSDILKYHVINGSYPASSLTSGLDLVTLNGKSVKVTKNGTSVLINGAQVLAADVGTSNGLIHVIDTVLMPSKASLRSWSMQSLLFTVIILLMSILH